MQGCCFSEAFLYLKLDDTSAAFKWLHTCQRDFIFFSGRGVLHLTVSKHRPLSIVKSVFFSSKFFFPLVFLSVFLVVVAAAAAAAAVAAGFQKHLLAKIVHCMLFLQCCCTIQFVFHSSCRVIEPNAPTIFHGIWQKWISFG